MGQMRNFLNYSLKSGFFLCPIIHTGERNPVLCTDGYLHEKKRTQVKLSQPFRSPITRQISEYIKPFFPERKISFLIELTN